MNITRLMNEAVKNIDKKINAGISEKEQIKSLLTEKTDLLAKQAESVREYWRNTLDKRLRSMKDAKFIPWEEILQDIDQYVFMVQKATDELSLNVVDKHVIYTNFVVGDAPAGKSPRFDKGDIIDIFPAYKDPFRAHAHAPLSANLITSEYSLAPRPAKVQCSGERHGFFDDRRFTEYLQRNWCAIYSVALKRLYSLIGERVQALSEKREVLEEEVKALEDAVGLPYEKDGEER